MWPCRVGITTNLTQRESDWRRVYPNLYNFRTLETHSSKSSARQQKIDLRVRKAAPPSPAALVRNTRRGMYTGLITR